MQDDLDYVAKWLASQYNLAPKGQKDSYIDPLVVALEGASEPTREAIAEMLGIVYTYPGDDTPRNRPSAA